MTATYLGNANDHELLEWHGGSTFAVLLDSVRTDGQLTVGRNRAPKGAAAPFHVHTLEDEMFFMISGSALLWSGDDQYELTEGGIVFLPRHIPHGYRVTSDMADFLLLTTPGGIEGMFRKAGRDVSEPRPDGFEVTIERMVEAAAAHGQTVVGPPR